MIHLGAVSLHDISETNNPKNKHRANNCKIFNVDYVVNHPDKMIVLVKCYEKWSDSDGWVATIAFDSYVPKKRDTQKPLNVDVRINCSCPAFTYWGSRYIATIYNYNYGDEEYRYPVVRDPSMSNKACKHIEAVVNRLKKTSTDTFRKILRKWGDKTSVEYWERIEKTRQNRKQRKASVDLIQFDGVVSVDETKHIIKAYAEQQGFEIRSDINRLNFEEIVMKIGLVQ